MDNSVFFFDISDFTAYPFRSCFFLPVQIKHPACHRRISAGEERKQSVPIRLSGAESASTGAFSEVSEDSKLQQGRFYPIVNESVTNSVLTVCTVTDGNTLKASKRDL